MKRKYKDILKNKWGWFGAVIGFSYLVYKKYSLSSASSNITQIISSSGVTPTVYKSPIQILVDSIIHQFETTSSNAFPFFSIPPIYETIFIVIVGFIAGIILQKIWRKIK